MRGQMSTPGDDDGELRIGGWVPPTERANSPDEAQVTQVIPAVGAEQGHGRHTSALLVHDNGGVRVDDRSRRTRRTAATVAVSVVFLAIAAGIPVMLAAFDEPSPPDNRVLPAPSLPAPPSVRVFPAPSTATTG